MPSRVLGMKTPYEMIYGRNEFIVPPKVLMYVLCSRPQPFSGKIGSIRCEVRLHWIFTLNKKATSVGVLLRGEDL
jgi:hypothetical protein